MSSGALYSEVGVLGPSRPLVLTLGMDEVFLLEEVDFGIRDLSTVEELLAVLEHEDIGVLVLGPRLKKAAINAILERIGPSPRNPLIIVNGFGREPALLQEFVDSGVLFFISRGPLKAEQLRAIVTAAVHRFAQRRDHQNVVVSSESRMGHALEYGVRLLNQADAASVSGLLVDAVLTVVGAHRARCLLYDAEKETLSSPARGEETTESAASGIAAFVARTGSFVHLNEIAVDPRYDPEVDNPGGTLEDSLVAAPLRNLKGAVIAVLVLAREPGAGRFSPDDMALVEFLLDCASHPLNLILLSKKCEDCLSRQQKTADVFRSEALDYHTGVQQVEGDLIQTSPTWLKRAHWLTVLLLAASLIFLVVAHVKEKAAGIAIIRARSKVTLAAPTGGLVRSVQVAAGERIKRGDLLVRFQDLRSTAGLDQLHEQLRAPGDGVIEDVLVRAGQQVSSGDPVTTIVDQDAGYELIVLLPGHYAPQIRRGMLGAFTVEGYPESHERVEISDVASEILGPREAAQYAGVTDAVTVTGPVVVVRCYLKSSRFSGGNKSYVYHDGMTARAEVDLRSEPMIVELLPGLKELLGNLK